MSIEIKKHLALLQQQVGALRGDAVISEARRQQIAHTVNTLAGHICEEFPDEVHEEAKEEEK